MGENEREGDEITVAEGERERKRREERVINVGYVARSSCQHPARKGQPVEMRPPLLDHASFRQ